MDPIIGIDLGTTNSEVAFIIDENITVLKENDKGIMPSCVGLNNQGGVIVGSAARNQAVLYPENTIFSVKRLMGTDKTLKLGHEKYTPQEISAFILKELKKRAERVIGKSVSNAVITSPAYFTDIQRQAIREAGEIAGLNVIRILNEPTAAALSYENRDDKAKIIMIYDLGGGTFDVSIVKIEDQVVEVLASTGDNHLGGDDFDRKIEKILTNHIKDKFDIDVTNQASVMARLKIAAERAKIELSCEAFVKIQEDHLTTNHDGDVHLDFELSRLEFENVIDKFLEKTMESVNKALKDALMLPSALDKIILVGGSTRIPKLSAMLEDKFGILPHQEIDPDLCVAMGAAIQACREMGIDSSGVLLDITPYTFGTSALGEIDGVSTPFKFVPLIRRNSKLPAVKSDAFGTVFDDQEAVDVMVYQGEKANARENIEIGKYIFKLSPRQPQGSIIVIKFELDINGILKIRAVEKSTGREITGVIENAFSQLSQKEIADSRGKIQKMMQDEDEPDINNPDKNEPDKKDNLQTRSSSNIEEMISRAKNILEQVSKEDQEDIINLIEDIHDALENNKEDEAEQIAQELEDILFYVE